VGTHRRHHKRTVTNKTKTIQHYFIFGKYHTVKPGQTIVVEHIEEIDDLDASHSHDEKYYSKTKVDELISELLKGSLDPVLETFIIEE